MLVLELGFSRAAAARGRERKHSMRRRAGVLQRQTSGLCVYVGQKRNDSEKFSACGAPMRRAEREGGPMLGTAETPRLGGVVSSQPQEIGRGGGV